MALKYATYVDGVGVGTPWDDSATPTGVTSLFGYTDAPATPEMPVDTGSTSVIGGTPQGMTAAQMIPTTTAGLIDTPAATTAPATTPTTAAPAIPATTSTNSGLVTVANGTQFTFGGLNADGTANWTRSDGQVFNNVDQATALSFGLSDADVSTYYGAGTTPTTSTGTGLINAPELTPTEVAAPASLEDRINDLTSQDSEYMQAAETAALQDMNARGLLSSSLAVGAAEAARINAASQIAQGDLAAELETMGLSENARQFDSSLENEQWEFDENLQMEYWTQTLGDDQARDLAQLDADTRTQLAEIEQVYLSQAQMSASAVDAMTKGYAVISGILQDPNMDEASKQNAVDVMLGGLQEQMNMISAIYSAPTLSSQLVET